jgi:signal transduction histidine kinase
MEKILSKYTLDEILELENNAYAIADKNQKILWYNKSFKETVGVDRIKNKTISSLFPALNPEELKNLKNNKFLVRGLPKSQKALKISPLKSNKNEDGYFVRLESAEPAEQVIQTASVDEENSSSFQKEFQNILTLLVKETSLNNTGNQILQKCTSLTGSDFGIITFLGDNNKFEFLYNDTGNCVENKKEVEKDISANFAYIKKWLKLNKKPLVVLNVSSNIGYHLTELLKCKSLTVSPCFFEDNLLATIIIGKKDGNFSPPEINMVELFASLLAFTISSIRARELNAALESRLLQAQKLETIGKLSSGMAHDFNNLLSSIFGSLNLLKKRVPSTENITRLVDNIENCSIRARDLTKGLLSYGKPTPKRKELIKPNILLSEMSKVITQTFPKHIIFEQEIDKKLYNMLGNGTEIYQVLLNLCVNAKEAIGKTGKIKLTAKNITIDDKNLINYPLLNKGNYVRFSVKDSGSGISEENLQKIFDPYFSTKIKETGSGLGLYVTYGIIKAHNGHIEVTSKAGEGTEFEVFIPSYEPTLTEKSHPADKIILLVDDEIMLRDLLAELLESNGYTVIKVISGIEALKVLTEEIKVDLAIIDYNMPGMNGFDCIKEIRKLKFDIPIILSSGSLAFDGNVDTKKTGINSIVSKPYEFETMLSTIQQLI